jgi:SAM-dependent methyltransferase
MLSDRARRGGHRNALGAPAAGEDGLGSGRTRECYAYLWRFKAERIGWQHKLDEERGLFLRNMSVAAEELPGRTLLDAGCGDGRFTASLAGLGLETIGIDLSEGVDVGYSNDRDPLVHYVQGDLLEPPLRAASFDYVWSFGVLHHTPDTRRAFAQCAVLLHPGGRLFVWLYDGAPKGRSIVIRLSQRAPLPIKRLVSHAFAFGNRVKRTVGAGNPVTVGQTADEVYFWNLDMYGPEHRHLQSPAEVRRWFDDLGFDNVTPRERMEFGFGMTGDLPYDCALQTTCAPL